MTKQRNIPGRGSTVANASPRTTLSGIVGSTPRIRVQKQSKSAKKLPKRARKDQKGEARATHRVKEKASAYRICRNNIGQMKTHHHRAFSQNLSQSNCCSDYSMNHLRKIDQVSRQLQVDHQQVTTNGPSITTTSWTKPWQALLRHLLGKMRAMTMKVAKKKKSQLKDPPKRKMTMYIRSDLR